MTTSVSQRGGGAICRQPRWKPAGGRRRDGVCYDLPLGRQGRYRSVLHRKRPHACGARLPFLGADKPVFIDKPLCEDAAEAQQLQAAADANGTYFFSSSPSKWAPAVASLLEQLPRIGSIRTVVATGPAVKGAHFYVTHAAELLQRDVGPGARAVRCRSNERRHHIEISYGDGTVGIVNWLRGTRSLRHVVAYGEDGYLEVDASDRNRDEGTVSMLRVFAHGLRSGRPPPMNWAVEVVGNLAEAERSAQGRGALVTIS